MFIGGETSLHTSQHITVPTWPPELIVATLVNAFVYSSCATARFRRVPEAAFHATSLKIGAQSIFDGRRVQDAHN